VLGSLIVYAGVLVAIAGFVLTVKPIRRLGSARRSRGLLVAGLGALTAGIGLTLPASESRVGRSAKRLDEFAPRWQFQEYHELRVSAPPDRVYEAIKGVRAEEIFLFETLTWIRRGGRAVPQSILNAGNREPLIDVATRGGFVILADHPPHELVLGTIVMAPPAGTRGTLTPAFFQKPLPPGFAIAAMNFLVVRDESERSIVSTETRVFAGDLEARRRFARYWRVIYPGSAIIRRMWLRAISRRAGSRHTASLQPLKIHGGSGSTVAPIAIR
jgi:hypothetical protein